jgi:hypothetical protein
MFIYLTYTKVWHVCQTNMIEIVLPWQGPSQNHIFSNHPIGSRLTFDWVCFSSFSRSTCLVGFLCAFWMVEITNTHTHTHTYWRRELDRLCLFLLYKFLSIHTLCNHQFVGKKLMTLEVQSWPDLCFFPHSHLKSTLLVSHFGYWRIS